MSLKLIKFTYESQLVEMLDEWRADQDLNHTNHSPWAIFIKETSFVYQDKGRFF